LDPDAASVYRVILANPHFGVQQLTESLGWPPERVHTALDELARLSLIRSSWEKPESLRAVSPEVGLTSLLAQQEQELLLRQQEIAASKLAVTQLIDEYTQHYRPRRRVDMEHLRGIDEIRSRIEELATACRSELMAFAPHGTQSVEAMEASKPLDQAVLDRHVLMRTVYVHSIYNSQVSLDYAQWLVASGAQVRTTAALSLRLIVYDREIALVPVDPDVEAEGAVLMHGTGVVRALCEQFEQVWQAAEPLSTKAPRRSGDEPTPQELAVLRLMADGHTDEVIARRLGVSIRTSRRFTAELMTKLGARSRFQAGARAMELGWLGSRPDLGAGDGSGH
jgi:DNA-binding CsgD family transcriptional regulator/sugar-specific transcriptional regulator TrmB